MDRYASAEVGVSLRRSDQAAANPIVVAYAIIEERESGSFDDGYGHPQADDSTHEDAR